MYLIFSSMQKENANQNRPNENTFVLNFLKALRFNDPKRFPEVVSFFCEALLNHVDEDEFEDKEYRIEWQDNISYIANLSKQTLGLGEKEMYDALNQAIKLLEKGGSDEN